MKKYTKAKIRIERTENTIASHQDSGTLPDEAKEVKIAVPGII